MTKDNLTVTMIKNVHRCTTWKGEPICEQIMNTKSRFYPKRLIGDEGKVGSGCLLLCPFPRNASAAQKLTVREAGAEFQGHVIRRLLLLRVTSTGQAHVKAEGRRRNGRWFQSQINQMHNSAAAVYEQTSRVLIINNPCWCYCFWFFPPQPGFTVAILFTHKHLCL